MRFYGGTPMSWLAETPGVVVQACVTMLPRLKADEALSTINHGAVAAGRVESGQASALARSLQLLANGDAGAPRVKRDPGELRALGFAVRRVPRQKAVS